MTAAGGDVFHLTCQGATCAGEVVPRDVDALGGGKILVTTSTEGQSEIAILDITGCKAAQ